MTQVNVFDSGVCSLGEGALWHPTRNQFFWFDINNNALFSQEEGTRIRWDFDAHVTAAGWVNEDQLMIAHETSLLLFNLKSRESEKIVDLEAYDPITRSNDGRADPWGGFWIGTMGKKLEKDAGAIYRYYRGELRTLYTPWTIPNARKQPCCNQRVLFNTIHECRQRWYIPNLRWCYWSPDSIWYDWSGPS